ncbi:MAG: hypothetical protein MUQ27_11450, partial [Acidimicrobiia bacterium]|nr:hypothetical protein [Acidimicrobiia bacterium]
MENGRVDASTVRVGRIKYEEVVMRRVGLIVVMLVSVAACSSGTGAIEVTGNTGMCTNSGGRFYGEPPAGSNLPGG